MSTPTYGTRWEKLELLGEGGQGRVFRAKDRTKAGDTREIQKVMHDAVRRIASYMGAYEDKEDSIKLLKQAIENITEGLRPENQGALKVLHEPKEARDPENAEERIRREMEAMAEVEHPNLLRVLDKDVEQKWFVAEYHPNGTLDECLGKYSGDLLSAVRSIRPVVAGVAELHSRGIVHRDIKPQNVFVAADGRLVLGDFGLAFFEDERHTRLSATFENVGSWDWMPQWATHLRIEDVSPAFDVFSLGKVIWAMVSNVKVLKLWYYDREPYNVEKQYPDSPAIQLASTLFSKCIVEEEEDCLPNAQSLLQEIDGILEFAHTSLKRQRLHKKFRDTFQAGHPTSFTSQVERDYFVARLEDLQDIHVVILSMLFSPPSQDEPNEWLRQQPRELIESAQQDLVSMGMANEVDVGHLMRPEDYVHLHNRLTDAGRRFVKFLLGE